MRNRPGRRRWLARVLFLAGLASVPRATDACQESFDSTFALIQKVIFERHGCTSSLCHDASASGGLNLLPDVAYANLVDALVQSIPQQPLLVRVYPAKKENSLLWLNTAAAVLPEQWTAPLRPMPIGFPPLSLDELEVLGRWIEAGAPRDGVVPHTGEILDACLPPLEPLEVKPLEPPPPGTGVQFRAPRQIIPPKTEREVCFISYYDFTDDVPVQFRGENGTFRYKRINARQDALSHHAVLVPYEGKTPLKDPVWGPFICGGGSRDGEPCDPEDTTACGLDGNCGSNPTLAVACIGFGPGDATIGVGLEGVGNDSLFNFQNAGIGRVEGVYAEAPLKGIFIWNSHGYNVTDIPGKLDIWINLEFAPPEEQRYPVERFSGAFAQFTLDVPPFGTQQLCAHQVVPAAAHVLELSSHNHKRGKRFEVWTGRFACVGGPNDGAACSPFEADAELPHPARCAGAPCIAKEPPAAGDCNGDLTVTVDEVLMGINISLGATASPACPRFDVDANERVSINELVASVNALLHPHTRDPNDSLIYVSLTYADPIVTRFDPPIVLGGTDSSDAERTITYCSVYDNGYVDPTTVKRRSTSPLPTQGFPGGGPCEVPTGCTAGRVGEACTGDTPEQREASCDSPSGAGDGECDACPLRFGTTTEDEMFVVLGAYYTD